MSRSHAGLARLWAVAVSMLTASAVAQVPETLRYQGYLSDDRGQPVDGAVAVTLALYNREVGGTPLWTDTQLAFPAQGLFSVSLGGPVAAFPSGLFDGPLYLGITVDSDEEMMPRVVLSSVPYAQKALDATSVGGLTAEALDQSADVVALGEDVAATAGAVVMLESEVSGAQAGLAAAQGDIVLLQGDAAANASDIDALQSDLATTVSDLAVVEDTIPTLQVAISGQCASGSSIRQISPDTGAVTCETDDDGPWSPIAGGTRYASGGVVIGDAGVDAALTVDAPGSTQPLRVYADGSTALRVDANRGLAVGSSQSAPARGLYVAGDVGLGTSAPAARLSLADSDWQLTLRNDDSGGNEWHIGSSAGTWGAGAGKLVVSPTSGSSNAVMVMDADKNVGIDTVVPETRLHIKGGNDVTPAGGGYLTLGDTGGSNIAIDTNEIMARNGGAVASLALNAQGGLVTVNADGDGFADAMRVLGGVEFAGSVGSLLMAPLATGGNDSTMALVPDMYERGNVGTADFPLFSMHARTFYAGFIGGYQVYSDRALKRDVTPITDALETIGELEGVRYARNPHPANDGRRRLSPAERSREENQLGLIAQDVERVLPQLVHTEDGTGLKSVGYMALIPLLIEGIKEQQRQIETQRAQIEAQQAQLDALASAVARLTP